MSSEEPGTVVENKSSTGHKSEFYLQQKKPPRKNRFEDSSQQKTMKKSKRSPNIFNTFFRKKRANHNLVFGLPLAEVCEENLDPPDTIIKLMVLVYQQGPDTPGILRKNNNAALGKDIRKKIDSGDKYTLEDDMALAAASVFKEFLRFLPDGLLMRSFHEQWLTFQSGDSFDEKINKIKTILAKLPPVNYNMIKLTICLLQHLAKHAFKNHMGPSNLATCIAPSMYAHGAVEYAQGKNKGDVQKQMQESMSEIRYIIVPLVTFMITNHIELFGEDILSMFVKYGCQASPAQALDEEKYDDSHMQPSAEEDEDEEDDMAGEEEDNFNGQCSDKQFQLSLQKQDQHGLRQSNSGTDSDSMHSVLSMQDAQMGMQRDDSSIDSLGEREYDTHGSPKAMKSHLSPSNLSRDSGLTLSDNQLYDEEAAYQADIASTSVKMFHQRVTPFTDYDAMDTDIHNFYSPSTDYHTDKTVSPVPPPRKLSIRRKMLNMADNNAKQRELDFSSQHAPLKYSASTTHLDNSHIVSEHRNQRPVMTHALLDKRVSRNSIGEKQKAPDVQSQPTDFLRMNERIDIGTLVKSESGAHLFLNEETLPTVVSLGASTDFLREFSVSGSSLPMSLESRHSQSSLCDSVISDSTYSISRDGSVNSAPLTPDESHDTFSNWVPDINLPDKPWHGLLTPSLNTQRLYTSSKSTDTLPTKEDSCDYTLTSENSLNLDLPKLLSENPNKVECVQIPHFSPLCKPCDVEFSMCAPPDSSYSGLSRKQRPTHVGSGSPPPSVILQTIPSSFKRDLVPLKARFNLPQRRSSVDSIEPKHSKVSLDMQSIRPEDYISVTPKPIIISPESSLSNSASSATTSAKLSKYMPHREDLPLSFRDSNFELSKKRQFPEILSNYQQVITRNDIKYDIPDDVTENQVESSARAKRMYELSLQQYNQQTPSDIQSAVISRSNMNLAPNCDLVHAQKPKSEFDMTNNMAYATHSGFQQEIISHNADDSGASGFLDMRSISHILHDDIVSKHSEGNTSSSVNPHSLVSLSRNGSKLSDTGSSSGSSVTISTLSKHSDSFGRCSGYSDVSSVTVSSVTSSDSNPEANLKAPRLNNVTRYDQQSNPIETIRGSCINTSEMMENTTDDGFTAQKINSEEMYLRSKQIYEENTTSGLSMTQNKQSLKLPSSYSQHPRQQGSGDMLESLLEAEATKLVNSPWRGHKESKARLNLEVQNFNLHRTLSDYSEHKPDTYSPHTTNTRCNNSENNKEVKQHSSKDTHPQGIRAELHDNFLKARSCFHQPEITKSSSKSSHLTTNFVHQSPSAPDNQSKNWPHPALPTTITDNTTAALPPVLKPKMSDYSSLSQENKKEFHWSVKDLMLKYDNTSAKSGEGSSRPTSHISSQSRPHSPPPYQHPPPFRHPDSPRNSVCSSSSSSASDQVPGANKKFISHRQGPQSHILYTNPHSSSDDSYDSSPDRQPTWLSNSSLDDEELSDYTNTTYI